MCGIAGLWNLKSGEPADTSIVREMCRSIRHRGPDGEGVELLGDVGLGHRRLSIIDLEGGGQPMSDSAGKIWVTFNGEIYNFPALRREFEADGVVFRTRSDTEVIPYCYLKYGDGFASRLEGMFAIALWDSSKKRLLLTRDRMGKKPLLYFRSSGGLIFASEMQALARHPDFRQQISAEGLDAYLTLGYVPHTTSIFEGVKKVAPAHTVIVDQDGSERALCYWSIDTSKRSEETFDESKQRLKSLLRESVEKRLISDVPLGAFLSGGTDSSLIAAIASEVVSTKLQTFCIGFDEQAFDERDDARAVADILGTDHHEAVVRFNGVNSLPRLQKHVGEPFADASVIPTFYLCEQLRKDVTVAISGDGGDELFLGYRRYHRLLTRHRLHEVVERLPMSGLLADASRNRSRRRKGGIGRFLNLLEDAGLPDYEQFALSSSHFAGRERLGLYNADLKEVLVGQNPAMNRVRTLFEKVSNRPFAEQIGLVDQRLYMVDDILAKVDIASMAASLEVRAPLLDHKLVEFAAALPVSYKIHKNRGKILLKAALADYIPQQLVDKPKQGFGVPVADWMRTSMREMTKELLLQKNGFIQTHFDQKKIAGLLDIDSGGQLRYPDQLWTMVCLGVWADQAGLNR